MRAPGPVQPDMMLLDYYVNLLGGRLGFDVFVDVARGKKVGA